MYVCIVWCDYIRCNAFRLSRWLLSQGVACLGPRDTNKPTQPILHSTTSNRRQQVSAVGTHSDSIGAASARHMQPSSPATATCFVSASPTGAAGKILAAVVI